MNLKKVKIGDDVNIECWSAQGDDTVRKVTDITIKYNENSGTPYKVIWCGMWGFSTIDGDAITIPLHYSIIGKVFKKRKKCGKSLPPRGSL